MQSFAQENAKFLATQIQFELRALALKVKPLKDVSDKSLEDLMVLEYEQQKMIDEIKYGIMVKGKEAREMFKASFLMEMLETIYCCMSNLRIIKTAIGELGE